jgi:HYR domain
MRFRLLLMGLAAGALLLISTGSAAPPPIRVDVPLTTEATSLSATSVTYNVKAYDTTVDPNVPITATCTGGSGSGDFAVTADFPFGNNSAECTATLGDGTPVSQTFSVAVVDTTAPSFGPAPPVTESTNVPTGKTVSYETPTGTDLGQSLTVNCSPASGSQFVVGTTQVDCSANDGRGNTGHVFFNVTVTFNDTQAPTFTPNPPPPISATTSSTGAVVNYAVAATDDSGTPTVNCTPASGSTFPVGQTTVNCTASDGTNTTNASFIVTVTFVDTAGPTFSNVPSGVVVEANGPSGSVATYTAPTATDAADGPEPVSCSPASGSTFPLGVTTVTCTASDSHGNASAASFTVTVADTTKPSLIVPQDRAVYADTPLGIGIQGYGVPSFLSGASATDTVDPNPTIGNNAPEFFTVGVHTVTFTASDHSGNSIAKNAVLEVLPMPPAGTPPLPIPPARVAPPDVRNLKAEAGDGRVRLTWQMPAGVDHVVISRSLAVGGGAEVVYTGSAEVFLDRGVANGLEYRYVVVSVDRQGLASAGIAASARPKRTLLKAPKDGARLRKAPKLSWVATSEASYYNVQLFRGDKKILSIWPVKSTVSLKNKWKYEGHTYKLSSAVYRWYVWPGFGARKAVDYGEMLGFSTFRIIR